MPTLNFDIFNISRISVNMSRIHLLLPIWKNSLLTSSASISASFNLSLSVSHRLKNLEDKTLETTVLA